MVGKMDRDQLQRSIDKANIASLTVGAYAIILKLLLHKIKNKEDVDSMKLHFDEKIQKYK